MKKCFLFAIVIVLSLALSSTVLAQDQASKAKEDASKIYHDPAAYMEKGFEQIREMTQRELQTELQDLLLKNKAIETQLREEQIRLVTRLAWLSNDKQVFGRFMSVIKPQLSYSEQGVLMDELQTLMVRQPTEHYVSKSDGVPGSAQFGTENPESGVGKLIPPASVGAAEWGYSATWGLRSRYLVPGQLVVPNKREVFTTDFTVTRSTTSTELSFGFSHVQGIEKCMWCSEAEEVDPTAAITFKFRGNRRLEVRYTHLIIGDSIPSDFANPSIKFSRLHGLSDTFSVTPFVAANLYIKTNKRGPRSGVIISSGADLAKQLPKGWSANLHAEVGYDPYGAEGFLANSMVYREDVSLCYTRGGWAFCPTATFAGTNERDRPGKVIFALTVTKAGRLN